MERKAETPEQRIERHLDAIEWYIAHPEASLEPNLRAFVDSLRKRLEEQEEKEAVQMVVQTNS